MPKKLEVAGQYSQQPIDKRKSFYWHTATKKVTYHPGQTSHYKINYARGSAQPNFHQISAEQDLNQDKKSPVVSEQTQRPKGNKSPFNRHNATEKLILNLTEISQINNK